MENHKYFTDIFYLSDAAKRITIEDPDSSELIGLDFGGNPISRVSTLIYVNGGYFHTYGYVSNHDSYLYKMVVMRVLGALP